MTPGARVQAAIEVLDRIASGQPAEKALLSWSRGARYAGSKDRRAVRDHVFDALRRWRSSAVLGGGETGRARMIGLLRGQGGAVDDVFSGQGHAPAPLTEAERASGRPPEGQEAWDLPDWLCAQFEASLGPQAASVAEALRDRGPVTLRVNQLKADPEQALELLRSDGIVAQPNPLSPTAITVTEGARGVARSKPFLDGLVELQDAASQAVVDRLPLRRGLRVLDYCAGGGGKTLAMAARMAGDPLEAHDADPKRMNDLPDRAARAGADIVQVRDPEGLYDLVLADAPCSGSGAWRRAPEAKWRLDPQRLDGLRATQADILDRCAGLVAPGGMLAYVTCSVLGVENTDQVTRFLSTRPAWSLISQECFLPSVDGDGLFVATMQTDG